MKNKPRSSLILIGMPGAGKSTLGVLLAKELALTFQDTDILLQSLIGESLQEYLDQQGYLALREQEESVLLTHDFSQSVVATGGSVVYSDKGMKRLREFGKRVYLSIQYNTLLQRVHNQQERGIACPPGTSLKALYEERKRLYETYADIVIPLDELGFEESVSTVMAAFCKTD